MSTRTPIKIQKAFGAVSSIAKALLTTLKAVFASAEATASFINGTKRFLQVAKARNAKAIAASIKTVDDVVMLMKTNPAVSSAAILSAAALVGVVGYRAVTEVTEAVMMDREMTQEARESYLDTLAAQQEQIMADANPEDLAALNKMFSDLGIAGGPTRAMDESVTTDPYPGHVLSSEQALALEQLSRNLCRNLAINTNKLVPVLEGIRVLMGETEQIKRILAQGYLED